MKRPVKVCFWVTTLQANVFSLAHHLCRLPQFEVVLAVPGLHAYLKEPINRLYPLTCPLIERDDRRATDSLKRFGADVTVVDNHYPPERLSPLLVNVWHGFGWRGPEGRAQFKDVYRSIKRLTGVAPDTPNPAFMWICAGETNRQYRIHSTGFHPENVFATGQAYTDDVVRPKISRDSALAYYPPHFSRKKICLFAPTWHFGRIFSGWGDDIAIIQNMIQRVDEVGGAMILRMHDRKRFDPTYAAQIEALSGRCGNVVVKFKDEQQDNLLDLTVADCMVSNYSSMLTFFYGTGKPSVHLYPFEKGREQPLYRTWKNGKVRERKASDPRGIWSLPPEDTGGPIAYSAQEALDQLETALVDDTTGRSAALGFIAKHCAPYDGGRCQALAELIQQRVKRLRGEDAPAGGPRSRAHGGLPFSGWRR